MSLIIEDSSTNNAAPEPTATEEKKTSSQSIPELSLQVILDIYRQGEPAPNQNQIVNRVTEIKNNSIVDCHYEPKALQPAVSRALKSLIAKNKIIKTKENRYLPYNLETGRALLKKEIIDTIKFGEKAIFQISSTTWLLDIERSSIANAKRLFAQYLGPVCYDIIEFNGYLMLMFSGKIEEHKELRQEIMGIRKEAIEKAKPRRSQG